MHSPSSDLILGECRLCQFSPGLMAINIHLHLNWWKTATRSYAPERRKSITSDTCDFLRVSGAFSPFPRRLYSVSASTFCPLLWCVRERLEWQILVYMKFFSITATICNIEEKRKKIPLVLFGREKKGNALIPFFMMKIEKV